MEALHKLELEQKDHEIEYLKAIVRQYRQKMKNVQTLAMAAIHREDYLLEDGNDKVERGILDKSLVTSDNEDDAARNKVHYTYIDNELFNNEE